MKTVTVPVGELRLGEVFRTALTALPGLVVEWGHTRPPGNMGLTPRPRWPVVAAEIAGRRVLLAPEIRVRVPASRPHWRRGDDAGRWVERVRVEG